MDNTTTDSAARWIERDSSLAELAPAIRLREAGRHAEAAAWLREHVEEASNNAAAYALLAQSFWQQRADADAAQAINRALQLDSNSPYVHRALAKGLLRLGRIAEALATAETAHRLDPEHPDSMLALGMALDAAGRGEEALVWLNRASHAWPDYGDIRGVRGLARRKLGDVEGALDDAEMVVELKPSLVAGWALLGQLRRQTGNAAGAIEAFERASMLEPANVVHLVNLGDLLRAAERLQDARRVLEAAVELAPASVAAWTNLGATLQALEENRRARQAYEQAVRLDPSAAEALHNLGLLSIQERDLQQGLDWFDNALAFRPQDPRFLASRAWALLELKRPQDEIREALDAAIAAGGMGARSQDEVNAALDTAIAIEGGGIDRLVSLGAALHQTGRISDALAQLDRAVSMKDPAATPQDISKAHTYRAFARLAMGLFEGGWRDYEHRWKAGIVESPGLANASVQSRVDPSLPLAALTGARVLVVGEQGIGDEIMFASMVPDLKAIAAEVRLFCEPRLRRLMSESFPDIRVVGVEAADEPFDRLTVLGSLGRLFRNRPEDFPGTPYLHPSEGARRRWAERLGPAEGRKRIGVSWKGGLVKTGVRARSMPLETLGPILSDPAYEIVSLQYGDNAEEVAAVNATLARPIRLFDKAEIDDFDELAGLVMNLDLVVSVQTSLVHLCGALGAPALVMIPRVAEWRYGAEGATMPWYRSVSLFRQGEDRSWPPVVARVAEEAARRLKAP